MNKSFKTLALLLAAISAVPVTATDSNVNPDVTGTIRGKIIQVNEGNEQSTRKKLLCLACACSVTVGSKSNQLERSMQSVIESLSQALPDSVDVPGSVSLEVGALIYKYAYNSILVEKKPNSILPPKILWMLPVPRDFKERVRKIKEVDNDSYARERGDQKSLMIEPLKSWFPSFPAEAKQTVEEFVQGFTEQEKVILLYALYVTAYNIQGSPFEPSAGYPYYGTYREAYCEVRKELAESSSPEERALFKWLYTPAVYEDYEAISKKIE